MCMKYYWNENIPQKVHVCVLIGLKLCFYNLIETENYTYTVAQAVDMIARVKRVYMTVHFNDQSKQAVFLFSSQNFLEDIK